MSKYLLLFLILSWNSVHFFMKQSECIGLTLKKKSILWPFNSLSINLLKYNKI